MAETANGRRAKIAVREVEGRPRGGPAPQVRRRRKPDLRISLALVNAQHGLLLIDEIENGIHYTIQEQLWRFLVQASGRLDVQVFATTHSWDCLQAFQRATADCGPEEGVVTRLEFRDGRIRASRFDGHDLSIATEEQIEIR